jgi:hypothetical protein
MSFSGTLILLFIAGLAGVAIRLRINRNRAGNLPKLPKSPRPQTGTVLMYGDIKDTAIPVVITARIGSHRYNKAQDWLGGVQARSEDGIYLLRPKSHGSLSACARKNGDFDLEEYLWRLGIRPVYNYPGDPAITLHRSGRFLSREDRNALIQELRALGHEM